MKRWILFFLLYPLNLALIFLQVAVTPLFMILHKNKFGVNKVNPPHFKNLDELIKLAKLASYDKDGFMRKETHTLLTQSGNGLFNKENQERLLEQVIKPNGSLYRERCMNGDEGEPHLGPSGDGLSSWVFNYILWNVKRPDLVKRIVVPYVKNCFGITWNEKGGVSNRSSNSGLNITIEQWSIKGKNIGFSLANPVTGPGFLTSQALLELAAKELGGKWKLIAFLHYWMLGGWYFSKIPVMYTKSIAAQIFYTQHISALNLWSLCELGKGYKMGLKFVDNCGPMKRAQPWITCLAWDQGLVNQTRREEAIKYLQGLKGAIMWPQLFIESDESFNQGYTGDNANYSMMGFAAQLLKME